MIGAPYVGTLYITNPPPTSVTVSIIAPCFSISPSSSLTFTPSIASLQFYYTPSVTCESSATIYGSLSGPDAGWYIPAFTDELEFSVSRRGVSLTGSLNVVSGIRSLPIIISLDLPGDITIVPNAPGKFLLPFFFFFLSN